MASARTRRSRRQAERASAVSADRVGARDNILQSKAEQSLSYRELPESLLERGPRVTIEIPFPGPIPVKKRAVGKSFAGRIADVDLDIRFKLNQPVGGDVESAMDQAAATLPTPDHGWVNVRVYVRNDRTTTDRCLVSFSGDTDMHEIQRKIDLIAGLGNRWASLFADWAVLCSNFPPGEIVVRGGARLLGEVPHEGHSIFLWPSFTPGNIATDYIADSAELDRSDIETLLRVAEAGEAIPTAWTLLRAAWSALIQGNDRVCVMEAGSSAELSLQALYESEIRGKDKRAPDITKQTLGLAFQTYTMKGGALPDDFTEEDIRLKLIKIRNEAAHRARAEESKAHEALRIASSLTRMAFPLPVNSQLPYGPVESLASVQMSAAAPQLSLGESPGTPIEDVLKDRT